VLVIAGFSYKNEKHRCWCFSDSDTNNYGLKIDLQSTKNSSIFFY